MKSRTMTDSALRSASQSTSLATGESQDSHTADCPDFPCRRRFNTDRLDTLWGQYLEKRDLAARNALIEAYIPIVRREAHKTALALSRLVSEQELESAGTVGLIDCIDNFDPSQGFKFVTFCTPRVRGAMIDELRSWDWTPRATRAKLNKLALATRHFEDRCGHTPDEEEIALEMGTSEDEVRRLFSARNRTLVSLDRTWSNNSGANTDPLNAVIEDPGESDPARYLQKKEIADVVRRSLTETERRVVTLYYYEQLTLLEVGRVLGVTESRVSQIHTKIVKRLRKLFA